MKIGEAIQINERRAAGFDDPIGPINLLHLSLLEIKDRLIKVVSTVAGPYPKIQPAGSTAQFLRYSAKQSHYGSLVANEILTVSVWTSSDICF